MRGERLEAWKEGRREGHGGTRMGRKVFFEQKITKGTKGEAREEDED
jgi:hypothetical protein